MISWVFAGITLGAVIFSAFAHDMRRAVLTLWVAGLSIGGLYLTLERRASGGNPVDYRDAGRDLLHVSSRRCLASTAARANV